MAERSHSWVRARAHLSRAVCERRRLYQRWCQPPLVSMSHFEDAAIADHMIDVFGIINVSEEVVFTGSATQKVGSI